MRTTCCSKPLGVVSTLRSAPCIPFAATSNSACFAFRFSVEVEEGALGIVSVLCAPTPPHNLMIERTPPLSLSHGAPRHQSFGKTSAIIKYAVRISGRATGFVSPSSVDTYFTTMGGKVLRSAVTSARKRRRTPPRSPIATTC